MKNLKEQLNEFMSEFESSKESLLKEYFEFLRIPSISSEAAYSQEMHRCCSWVAKFLEDAGLKVEIIQTIKHPIIVASWLGAGKEKPTLLFYNHYDVQPVDPLNLWESKPFEPEIRDGEIYARGAADNKGQCFYTIAAVRHLLKKNGSLPVNIKLLIEGEEECGSVGLADFLSKDSEKLKADNLYIVDMGLEAKHLPSVTLGVRGIVSMTVELIGSNGDLHSGILGGIVYNPNRAMTEILGKAYDEEGRVTIPGFYDEVKDFSEEELKILHNEFDQEIFEAMFGAEPTGGEKNYSPRQRGWIRPTLEINGIGGGYTGDGFKTVIPAKCIAKISCRLVPNQDPDRIAESVKNFFIDNCPPGIKINIEVHPGHGEALITSPNSAPANCAAKIYAAIFDKPCNYILSGGSIPIVPSLARNSDAEVVLIGHGLADDNIHAPNEHFGLDRLKNGFATIAGIIIESQNK